MRTVSCFAMGSLLACTLFACSVGEKGENIPTVQETQTPDNDTQTPDDDTGLPDDDTGLPNDDTDLPDDATGLPNDDTDLPDDDTDLHNDNTDLPDDDTDLPDENTDNPDDDTDNPDDDTDNPDDDTDNPDDDTDNPDDDTDNPDDDTDNPDKKSSSMGMGLGGIADWSTQYPFLDFMKSARSWYSQKDGAPWNGGDPLNLDENGWVRSLPGDHRAEIIFLTIDQTGIPFDRFIVRYEGRGTIQYRGLASKDESASGPGRDVVDAAIPSGDQGYMIISIEQTDPNDYIRNITVVPEQYVNEYDNGEIFNPLWIERIKDFRAVRFMDWMDTNNSMQSNWSERPRENQVSYAFGPPNGSPGVPIEVMVKLANKINADAWFNVPHLADENYIQNFAALVKSSLNASLVAYVEHSNEVWNWQFEQAQYANETGQARWGDVNGAWMQWHGMKTAIMCDIWKSEYGAESKRMNCVLGTQGGWHGLERYALDCPGWVAEGNAPCHTHGIDTIGITGYFSGSLHGGYGDNSAANISTIRSWFNDPDGGLTKAMQQLQDGRHIESGDSVADLAETYRYFKNVGDSHGMEVVIYEGGQHITGNGHSIQDDQAFIDFHIAINRDERIYDRYMENFNFWKNEGGTLFMHFVDFSRPGKWGSWGALEYLTQETSPKWRAITTFNETVECWWEGCE